MAHDASNGTDRRTFLQAGALATASALGTAHGLNGQEATAKSSGSTLPTRPLGKTGIDITILDQGTGKGPDVDRLLRYAFARGVRAYDTSETYHSEAAFKKWFQQDSAVRKQIFLVTKDAPKTPASSWGCWRSGSRRWGPTTSTCSSSTVSATTTRSTRPSRWSRARS